jgi:polyhydroxybutyrate depolymerase
MEPAVMNRLVGWWRVARLVPLPFAIAIGLAACQMPSVRREASPPSDAASAAQPLKLGDTTGELVHDGQPRTYHLYTPKSYRSDRPVPLVLAFHGYGSQGKDLANGSGFNEIAEQKGFVVVYPDGLERRWNR